MMESIDITIGGELIFDKVTDNIFEEATAEQREQLYAIIKANNWLHMIKGSHKPIKWYEPTPEGTKVKFELILSDEQCDQAIQELREYVDELNAKYNCGIELGEGDDE